MNHSEIQKLIDGLVVEETQPVSFSFMESIGKALSVDQVDLHSVTEKKRIIPPDELIQFLP